MIFSYATKSHVFHLSVTNAMLTGICESLNSMLGHATAARIWQPQTKVTDLSFAARDKEITSSALTNQESLL